MCRSSLVFINTVLAAAALFLFSRVYSAIRLFSSFSDFFQFTQYFLPGAQLSSGSLPRNRYAALANYVTFWFATSLGRVSHFITNWILSTNHRRIAVMYFIFTVITGFSGLILATIIRIELAYAGQGILNGNSEKYLTIVSLHGIIMVFFVVIPILFGAFGNFLLPTQLGIRDVAFPRLNSFMFWITPAGFVLLLHILLFDKSYSLTYWLNYSELKAQLRRRYQSVSTNDADYRLNAENTLLALRLATMRGDVNLRQTLVSSEAPSFNTLRSLADWHALVRSTSVGILDNTVTTTLNNLLSNLQHMGASICIAASTPAVTVLAITSVTADIVRGVLYGCSISAYSWADLQATTFSSGAYLLGVPETILANLTIRTASTHQSESLRGIFNFGTLSQLDVVASATAARVLGQELLSPQGGILGLMGFWCGTPLSALLGAARTVLGIYDRQAFLLAVSSVVSRHIDSGAIMSTPHLYPGYIIVRQILSRLVVNTEGGWHFNHASAAVNTSSISRFTLSGSVTTCPQYLEITDLLSSWNTGAASGLPLGLSVGAQSSVNVVPSEFSASPIRAYLKQYYFSLTCLDYLSDWRELKLEREIWRSIDDLSAVRKHWLLRKRYYSNFYAPVALVNKVSIWLPNHLIPGWAFITPYTSRLRYTALGKVDVALVVVLMASVGSVFSSVNYVITYRYIGAPTLKNRKELRSFYVDALLVGSRMMIVANPALIIGIMLLLSDRHLGTSVFDFSGGGDTILFQHLFWFFGHPEVYIVIIPCFGFMNSLLPFYLRKRLSGRLSLQFSMYTIAFMSFAVWGHHMYMVGLANSVRTLYSTGTVMISVPASTKILHWCVTLIQSSLSCDVGFLFLLCFMYFFVLGGLSGMFVAHLGFDVIFHDTFYVIGHFHVMFACASMCCIFSGFYFYFAAIFGVRYSRFFAYLHFFFFVIGQLVTIIPMMWLGYAGMPRRIMDYPAAFAGWHSIISSGHLLIVLSFVFFLLMILDSIYENRAPVAKTRGVSRLNTRLGFYAYEMRKLKYSRSKSQNLVKRCYARRGNTSSVFHLGYVAESVNFEYIFNDDSTSSAAVIICDVSNIHRVI